MSKKTEVQIIIGSNSDQTKVKPALDLLDEFGISYDFKIASAHRTPEFIEEIIDIAINNGVKVFITGAGMANHLSGAVAARTTLPVIGIPFSGGAVSNLDALLSTLQMPSGVPVATVAVDGSKNAAFLAMQILAVNNLDLQKKIIEYRHKEAEKIKNAL